MIDLPTDVVPVQRRNGPYGAIPTSNGRSPYTLTLASTRAYSERESDIMPDVEFWDDPAELRIRLDVAMEENTALREENRHLRALLGPAAQAVPSWDDPPPAADAADHTGGS